VRAGGIGVTERGIADIGGPNRSHRERDRWRTVVPQIEGYGAGGSIGATDRGTDGAGWRIWWHR
jgi:hypothetical protein